MVQYIRNYNKCFSYGKFVIEKTEFEVTELPTENKKLFDCLPEGKYECEYVEAVELKNESKELFKCYKIKGTEIYIHSVNRTKNLRNRIIVGMGDNEKISGFESMLNYINFELEIINTK